LVGFSSLQAQTATPGVTQSQINQQKRIRQGVRSGELTGVEAVQLERQQRRIHRSKRAAKSDGVVTPEERVRLNARQRRSSRNIYRQKHDRQDRN
jgi:hypothetical protein